MIKKLTEATFRPIKILFIAFFCCSLWSCTHTTLDSTTTNYAIIVDAGSSGSRVHLFSYKSVLASNQNPNIQEIDFYGTDSNKSVIPITNTDLHAPLATFEQPFDLVLAYLQSKAIRRDEVNLYVYSTAGMRLLDSATRHQINNAIALELNTRYPDFRHSDVKTISGQDEALYAWLGINYAMGNIDPNAVNTNPTNGTIDVGGASTQIAYEIPLTEARSDQNNYHVAHLNLFGKSHHLYLNSILRGGQDQMRNHMNLYFSSNNLTNACYITGSDNVVTNAAFNDQNCLNEYNAILSSNFTTSENPVSKSLIPLSPAQTKFVTTGSVYFSYNFFGAPVNSTVTVQSLQNNYQHYCYDNWVSFKTTFATANPKFISQQCANAVYIYGLLTAGAYNLSNNAAITVSTSDWTSGAILMISSGTID